MALLPWISNAELRDGGRLSLVSRSRRLRSNPSHSTVVRAYRASLGAIPRRALRMLAGDQLRALLGMLNPILSLRV